MRKSSLFLIFLAVNIFLLCLMLVHASLRARMDMPLIQEKREMVKRFELTDLCLFTEASYTRHLSQADLHTPFQDYPVSLEHFPSGSIARPPETLRKLSLADLSTGNDEKRRHPSPSAGKGEGGRE